MRSVRYADSPVGLSPTQVDYADYREVAGVKMPFRWTVAWLDGRSIFTLSYVQANAAIDAAKSAALGFADVAVADELIELEFLGRHAIDLFVPIF